MATIRTETEAYRVGYEDGLAWDLDGFHSIDDVRCALAGWDEATINAIGATAFAVRVGAPEGSLAFGAASDDYNRGALAGALAPQGERTGLPPGREEP